MVKRAKVVWMRSLETCKSEAIDPKDGKYISIAKGVSIESNPKIKIKRMSVL